MTNHYADEIAGAEKIPFDYTASELTTFPETTAKIAYILTTSGTTGNPKMVQVSFDNLYWLLKEMNDLVPFKEGDTFIISTPPQFDVSFHENLAFIFGTGILQFVEPGTPIQQFKHLKDFLINDDITHIALSPSSLKTILSMAKDKFKKTHLRYITLAGEALPVGLANQLLNILPNAQILNCYGPTETTIYATFYKVNAPVKTSTVPIGQEIAGADIKFSQDGKINSESGEILIGGQGVSEGYYGNPELTAEKFINYEGNRYYRTGDLGYLENGLIYYQGRQDRQVKINGIRIELEEIEQVIGQYVADYVHFNVLKIDNNLVLFSDQKLDFAALVEKLHKHLPDYMVPSHYLQVAEMKLTASNKLDTEYLKQEFAKSSVESKPVSELGQLNQLVADILKVSAVSDSTNLLLLSQMDSLKQVEIIVALEEMYHVDLAEDFIKKNPTIAAIKRYFNQNDATVVANKLELSEVQKHNYLANLQGFRELNNLLVKNTSPIVHNASYLQKSYLVDGFKQILELKVSLPIEKISEIEAVLAKVIAKNELLRATLNEQHQLLIYEPFKYRIPVVNSSLLANLQEDIIQDLQNNPLNHLLWEVYFVEDKQELHFFINHLITDQSSLGILEKDLLASADGQTLPTVSFTDFVDFIEKNSHVETLEKVCQQGFKEVAPEFFGKTFKEAKQYFKHKTPYKSNYDNIVYGNYLLAKLLADSQKQTLVAGSTIINLRQFDQADFQGVFGDVHTTIPLIYRAGESEATFKERFTEIYRHFVAGDNLNHTIYQNYPEISEDLKQYEFYLDDNLKFSNNFLGAIREKDLDKTIETLVKQQYSLESFSKAKLYNTFFICGDELIFVPITQHLLDI
ncbi:MAG: AMP-binding protein [Lactobacillus sp.]|nr:AMP-binding protein [Lactobacillus sp.]